MLLPLLTERLTSLMAPRRVPHRKAFQKGGLEVAVETSTGHAEEFSARILDVLNSGMLALLLSIGHRTGLFEMLASHPAATAAEVAEVMLGTVLVVTLICVLVVAVV
jgi:hypothetical protein